jgi:hypothetical protein
VACARARCGARAAHPSRDARTRAQALAEVVDVVDLVAMD